MHLTEFLSPDQVLVPLRGNDRDAVLGELAAALELHSPRARGHLVAALRAREELSTTALDDGTALPHCRDDSLDSMTLAVGVSPDGIWFDPQGKERTHLFFAFAAPTVAKGLHLKVLARLSALLRAGTFRESLRSARTPGEVHDLLVAADAAQELEDARRSRSGS
jgi:PTS system nitrogen regulatory IIA component